MPSFDISSEADLVALKNAIDVAGRHIGNRYDFKGTAAAVELLEKEQQIVVHGDSEFQLNQVKDILFPEMEKKQRDSTRRLEAGSVQTVSGQKVKQELQVKTGIDAVMAKQIVRLVKDSKVKAQASIQGDSVRVSSSKRDTLQQVIAMVKETISDYPLNFGNFRD